VQHDERPPHVHVEVFERLLHRLGDRAEGGEVDDGVDSLQGARHRGRVTDIAFEEFDVDAVEVLAPAAREVVERPDLDAALE
jgi:hypothetical protein